MIMRRDASTPRRGPQRGAWRVVRPTAELYTSAEERLSFYKQPCTPLCRRYWHRAGGSRPIDADFIANRSATPTSAREVARRRRHASTAYGRCSAMASRCDVTPLFRRCRLIQPPSLTRWPPRAKPAIDITRESDRPINAECTPCLSMTPTGPRQALLLAYGHYAPITTPRPPNNASDGLFTMLASLLTRQERMMGSGRDNGRCVEQTSRAYFISRYG